MQGLGKAGGMAERGGMGLGLEAANAIRGYLDKARGDARLALALSVADSLALCQAARTGAASPQPRDRNPQPHV